MGITNDKFDRRKWTANWKLWKFCETPCTLVWTLKESFNKISNYNS